MSLHSHVTRLVKTASAQKKLSGIHEMLRVVAEELKAWGALIWMTSPGANPETGHGRLFVLADWVTDTNLRPWHTLGFQSAVGWTLRAGVATPMSLGDERLAEPVPEFIRRSGSLHFCLAPMIMQD